MWGYTVYMYMCTHVCFLHVGVVTYNMYMYHRSGIFRAEKLHVLTFAAYKLSKTIYHQNFNKAAECEFSGAGDMHLF